MKQTHSFISGSVAQTYEFAHQMARECHPGEVLCLYGTLGAGKTHFVKGFASAFGIHMNEVDSPTFVIIQEYEGTLPIYHFDAYRLKSIGEARNIGAEEYFYGEGISVIEWPERIAELLPKERIDIYIEQTGEQQRSFRVVYRN